MESFQLFSFIIGLTLSLVIASALMGSVHFRHHGGKNYHPAAESRNRSMEDIAEQMNMTHEELQQELLLGKSMMDVANERGVVLHLPPRWINNEDRQYFLQNAADRIGIPLDELKDELSSGKRLLDIAEEHGVELTIPDRSRSTTP